MALKFMLALAILISPPLPRTMRGLGSAPSICSTSHSSRASSPSWARFERSPPRAISSYARRPVVECWPTCSRTRSRWAMRLTVGIRRTARLVASPLAGCSSSAGTTAAAPVPGHVRGLRSCTLPRHACSWRRRQRRIGPRKGWR